MSLGLLYNQSPPQQATTLLLLLLLFILTANGYLPGGSGTTIRYNTQHTE
jgi:hypothetical protein